MEFTWVSLTLNGFHRFCHLCCQRNRSSGYQRKLLSPTVSQFNGSTATETFNILDKQIIIISSLYLQTTRLIMDKITIILSVTK